MAVVPVVLYHFGVPGFSGGFVGVDIFFVISGYLITSLIDAEIADNRFSLVDFYERRVRRIFPALVSLLAAVSVLASLELFPHDFSAFGESVTATSLFVSNIDFWLGTGYFAAGADTKPLLHTWSLAVEEQFYLFFPPLMILLSRYARKKTATILTILSVGSFALSIFELSRRPDSAFFLLPFRAWELGIGVLIAVRAVRLDPGPMGRNILSAIGMAMIGYSVVGYSSDTDFPGLAASLPCFGAGCIIYSGLQPGAVVNKVLSTWPAVAIGKISYSLYLWHWPIYVLAKQYVGRELHPIETSGLIFASVVAATISWRYIEQPFRKHGGVVERGGLFFQAAASMALLAIFGTVVSYAKGFPERFAPEIQTILASDGEGFDCRGNGATPCKIGRSSAEPTFMLWGDSHARAIVPALEKEADRDGASGLAFVASGCVPLLGLSRSDAPGKYCRGHNNTVREFLESHPHIDVVILASRWVLASDGTPYGNEMFRPLFYEDDESVEPSAMENRRVFDRSLRRTIDYLHASGRKIILVGPVPEIGWNVPQTLARRRMHARSANFGPTVEQFQERNRFVFNEFDKQRLNTEIVYPNRVLCRQLRCAVEDHGKPLYMDNNHLSRFGAEEISAIFDPVFASIKF